MQRRFTFVLGFSMRPMNAWCLVHQLVQLVRQGSAPSCFRFLRIFLFFFSCFFLHFHPRTAKGFVSSFAFAFAFARAKLKLFYRCDLAACRACCVVLHVSLLSSPLLSRVNFFSPQTSELQGRGRGREYFVLAAPGDPVAPPLLHQQYLPLALLSGHASLRK